MVTITNENSLLRALDLHPEKQLYMKKNIGVTDRRIRALAAIVLIALIMLEIIPAGALAILGWIMAAAVMLTSFISFSPIYSCFGVSSYQDDQGL